jgi:formate hydrogenlyase transcriptional activator
MNIVNLFPMENSIISNGLETNSFLKVDIIKSLQEREKEKDLLLTLSSEIAYVRDQYEFLPILRHHLKDIGLSDDFAINVLSKDRKTFGCFIIDSKRKRASDPNYKSIADAKHSYPDGFFELVIESKIPLIFNLEDLMKKKAVPDYISFLYDNGIREILSIALRDRSADIGGFFIFSETKRNY